MNKSAVKMLTLISLVFLFSGCALVDLTGSWTGTVTFTEGYCSGVPVSFTLDIVQDDDTVSGTLTFGGVDYSFTGSVSGMDFSVDGEEVSAEPWQSVELEGVASDSSSASGTFIYYGDGDCSGTFRIERGEPEVR